MRQSQIVNKGQKLVLKVSLNVDPAKFDISKYEIPFSLLLKATTYFPKGCERESIRISFQSLRQI